MASKRARKSKASLKKSKPAQKKEVAAQTGHSAKALHHVIQELIEAKQRGDDAAQHSATAALNGFARGKAPAHLQQAAAQAQIVASNPVMVDSMRLLGDIAARLGAAP